MIKHIDTGSDLRNRKLLGKIISKVFAAFPKINKISAERGNLYINNEELPASLHQMFPEWQNKNNISPEIKSWLIAVNLTQEEIYILLYNYTITDLLYFATKTSFSIERDLDV